MTGYTGPTLPPSGNGQTDGVFRRLVDWLMSTPMQGHLNASGLADIAGLTPTDGNIIVGDGTNFVAEGGATARASLGLTIGTHVQAWDADLDTVAGLAKTDGNFIVGNGSAWVAESGATARASLGLTIGTDVQAFDAQLADVAGLAVTDGNIIVGNGTNFVAESGATARTSLGLAIGTDVQAFDADLSAVAALATTGMLARTGAGTAATRTITAGDGISVADGDGVAGDPTITCTVTPNTVQVVNTQTGAVATGIVVIPNDDTVPQNDEGDEYMTLAITPTDASNILIIESICHLAHSAAAGNFIVALFQDTTADALAASTTRLVVTDEAHAIPLRHKMTAGTTSATTFKIRGAKNNAGTTTFNGAAGARKLGGVLASSITITEIKV